MFQRCSEIEFVVLTLHKQNLRQKFLAHDRTSFYALYNPIYTYTCTQTCTYTYTYIYIYMFIFICMYIIYHISYIIYHICIYHISYIIYHISYIIMGTTSHMTMSIDGSYGFIQIIQRQRNIVFWLVVPTPLKKYQSNGMIVPNKWKK